jgi:hypothetical protein
VESIKSEGDRVIYSFLDGDDWRESVEFAQLKETVSQNWEKILANIEEVVGSSEVHQYVLFESFYYLPQQDSFRCLDKIADLTLNKTISKQMFNWVIVSYHVSNNYSNRHTFSLNYKDPIVTEILRKAQIIAPELEWYRKMASGKAKREMTGYWYYDHGMGTYPNANPELEKAGELRVFV